MTGEQEKLVVFSRAKKIGVEQIKEKQIYNRYAESRNLQSELAEQMIRECEKEHDSEEEEEAPVKEDGPEKETPGVEIVQVQVEV